MPGKNVALSIENQGLIYEKKKENPEMSHVGLAQWAQEEFKLFKAPSASTISKVLKRNGQEGFQQTRIKDRKRTRMGKWPEMDRAVLCWIQTAQENNQPVHWNLIKTKAIFHAAKLGIPDFQASHGWMEKFAKRHGINMTQLSTNPKKA